MIEKMENRSFQESIIIYNKAIREFEKEQKKFELDVLDFWQNKGYSIRVKFFGDSFGIDIVMNSRNFNKVPNKLHIQDMAEFCERFGCSFLKTSGSTRWVFTFDNLNLGKRGVFFLL